MIRRRSIHLVLAIASASAPLEAQCGAGTWLEVPVPLPPQALNGRMTSVSATSSGDAWAIGVFDELVNPPFGVATQPIAWRARANTWSIEQPLAPVPYPGGPSASFTAIGVAGPNAVWIAGLQMISSSAGLNSVAMIQRFDGATWSQVPLPLIPALHADALVQTIQVLAPDDIWFGGLLFETSGNARPLAMHWNGQALQLAPTAMPITPLGNSLWTIADFAVVSTQEIYAVCQLYLNGRPGGPTRSNVNVVLRWNGSSWQQLALPPTPEIHLPSHMEALASNDLWIFFQLDTRVAPHALRYDGASWRTISGVPYTYAAASLGPQRLVLATNVVHEGHGAQWTTQPAFQATPFPYVRSMDRVDRCGLWAVGQRLETISTSSRMLPFATRFAPQHAADVARRIGCAAAAPAESLIASAPPYLGTTLELAAGDPTRALGLTAQQSFVWLGVSVPLGANGTCGLDLTRLGISGASGELLLDLQRLDLWLPGAQPWGGPHAPVSFAFPIPGYAALAGGELSAQALFFDRATSRISTSAALDLRLGY